MIKNKYTGFTLLELIIAITIIGIISVTAFSRFASEDAFAVRVEQENLISALNQAQQLAMAGQTVQFVITSSSSYTIKVGAVPVDYSLAGITYPQFIDAGVSLSPSSLTLGYSNLGSIGASTTITLSSDTGGSATVRVEESGYAHAN